MTRKPSDGEPFTRDEARELTTLILRFSTELTLFTAAQIAGAFSPSEKSEKTLAVTETRLKRYATQIEDWIGYNPLEVDDE